MIKLKQEKQQLLQLQFNIVKEKFLYSYLTIPYKILKNNNLKIGDKVNIINNNDYEQLGKFIIKNISYNPFKKKLYVTTNNLPAEAKDKFNNVAIFKV